jgi:DNA-binding beta-propeller fold protein YncE
MKIARKLYLGSSSLILSAMLVVGVTKVRADSDADDGANYGVRGNRITSNCVVSGGFLVLPQVPPPAGTDPCQGKVLSLVNSPNMRWSVDINWFDPATEKLYLADRNNGGVDVIDTKTETVVGFAGGFVGTNCPLPSTAGCLPAPPANSAGPNGVLTTTSPHQLWAGDGNGDIRVYSLDSNGLPTPDGHTPLKVISHLDPAYVALRGPLGAQRRADELAYDPDDQLILMAWDDDLDLFIALISVSSNPNNIKVVKTISFKTPNCPAFGGCATAGIEQPAYDPKSNSFYLAVPASTGHPNGEIVRINPKTLAVDGAFDTTGTAPAAGGSLFPARFDLRPQAKFAARVQRRRSDRNTDDFHNYESNHRRGPADLQPGRRFG